MKTYRIASIPELRDLAVEVYAALSEKAKEHNGAWVLALHGDLGAGKTTFVQLLVAQISSVSADEVTSPTFVVMKRYEPITPKELDALIHVDAYRIEDPAEMNVLHFDEILQNYRTIVCIEWAEKIAELLPPHTLHLSFAIEGEERIITLSDGKIS